MNMEYGTKYNEVMEHIHTDQAMRERILGKIESEKRDNPIRNLSPVPAEKKGTVIFMRRYGALAAMLVLILTLSLVAATGGLRKPVATPESAIPGNLDLSGEGDKWNEMLAPGDKDLDQIGAEIEYPEQKDYLEQYLYAWTKAPVEGGIPAFRTADRTAEIATLRSGEKVVVLASKDGSACVIALEDNRAFWIDSNMLLPEGEESSQTVQTAVDEGTVIN